MQRATVAEGAPTTEELSRALAEAFRTGVVGDLFTHDVFLDGHPPLWRFQIEGLDAFGAWLREYVAHQPDLEVVRTIATETGFVSEHLTEHTADGGLITARKVLVCTVRHGRLAEMTVYCSGDWDADLRARPRAEAPLTRP
jgi:hypothetical protein